MHSHAFRICLAALAALTFVACGGGDDDGDGAPPVVIDATKLESPVTVQVDPTLSTQATSADGALTITIPEGAVSEAVTITVSQLAASATPSDVFSTVYVLQPSLTFAVPVRLSLAMQPRGGVDETTLRLAYLDTGTTSYEVLADWSYLPGDAATSRLPMWSGDTTHFSAFGLSNGADHALSNDSPPQSVAGIGDDLLAVRQIAAARDAYVTAVTANPADLHAQLGAALTKLVLLPESAPVDDVLTLCGQPLADVQGQIFGDQGLLAWAAEHRKGASTLTLRRGTTQASLTAAEFVPNSVGSTLYTETDNAHLEVRAEDLRASDLGASLQVNAGGQVNDAAWVDGATFTLPGGPVWVNVWSDNFDGGDAGSWTQVKSGSLRVVQAGKAVGDTVQVELTDVIVERQESGMNGPVLIEVYAIDGSITDTIDEDFEPAEGSFPFMHMQDIEATATTPAKPVPVQILDACQDSVTEAYLMGKLDELVALLDDVRGHLDVIANSPSAATFVWELPAGTVTNGVAIPVSAVEVNVLRAVLFVLSGANDIVQQYNLIDPAGTVKSMFSRHDRYQTDCYDTWVQDSYGGHYETQCTTAVEDVYDMDAGLAFAMLDEFFLTPVTTVSTGSMTPARTSLTSALAALEAAMSLTPPATTLVNFQSQASAAAAAELIGFMGALADSLAGTDVTAENSSAWVLHLYRFFEAPFSRDSLLTASQQTSLWSYTPADVATQQNAMLEPNGDAFFEMVKTFLTIPNGPDQDRFCSQDSDCQDTASGGQAHWRCNEWRDQGVCSHDATVTCYGDSECNTSGSWVSSCRHDVCGLGGPMFFDEDVVGDAFDRNPPAFVNEAALEQLLQGF